MNAPRALRIPFTARGGSGHVSVTLAVMDDPVDVGQVPEAEGFPVCRASVGFDLDGYDGFLGWLQLVGTRSAGQDERVFEIDPLQVFEGLETPFAFYGLRPELFDAPYRRDQTRYLDWLAQSFLCVSPSHPMARNVQAVAGFSWGFVMEGGDGGVSIVGPEPIHSGQWSGHLDALSAAFPNWSFTDAQTW